jgi:hypothetical protein
MSIYSRGLGAKGSRLGRGELRHTRRVSSTCAPGPQGVEIAGAARPVGLRLARLRGLSSPSRSATTRQDQSRQIDSSPNSGNFTGVDSGTSTVVFESAHAELDFVLFSPDRLTSERLDHRHEMP